MLMFTTLLAADDIAADVWIPRLTLAAGLLTAMIGAVFAGLRSIGLGRQLNHQDDESAARHAENAAKLGAIETQLAGIRDYASRLDGIETCLASVVRRLDKLDPPAAADPPTAAA